MAITEIESVKLGGNGCLKEETSVVMSPDKNKVSVLFDNFIIEAGPSTRTNDRKTCHMSINFKVDSNKSVVLKKVDYRGYYFLPDDSRMLIRNTYKIYVPETRHLTRSVSTSKEIVGYQDNDLFFSQKIDNNVLKSQCGKDFQLNIRTTINSVNTNYNEDLYIAMDSADSGIDYIIETIDCTPSSGINRSPSRDRTDRNNRNVCRGTRRCNGDNVTPRSPRRIRRR